jgi:uncharacterized protein
MTETILPVKSAIDLSKPVPIDAIRALVARLVDKFRPYKVVLFGSHAYGAPKPWSDVDLLVVMDTELTLPEQRKELYEEVRDRQFGLDLIVRTPVDLEKRLEQGDFFLREIVSKGQVLYERSH